MTLIGWETRASSVVGIYRDRAAVNEAIGQLLGAGFVTEEISVVVHGEERGGPPIGVKVHDMSGGEGAVTGGLTGLAIGVAALAVPGLGPILAAGPLAAALTAAATAATGATIGGIAASLIHLGIPPDIASEYEERLHVGHVLVGVNTSASRLEIAFGILQSTGAEQLMAFQDGGPLNTPPRPPGIVEGSEEQPGG